MNGRGKCGREAQTEVAYKRNCRVITSHDGVNVFRGENNRGFLERFGCHMAMEINLRCNEKKQIDLSFL